MSSQPANSDIKIYRSVRAARNPLRHETVAALIKRLRPLVMAIPGQELLCGVLTRDTSTKDFSPYCGEARHNAGRGFPIVFGLKPQATFAQVVGYVDGLDFPIVIGQDAFVANNAAKVDTADLHKDVRAANPTY